MSGNLSTVASTVSAAEKQVETAIKQPSGANWLLVWGIAIAANAIGVLFHI